MTKQQTIFCFCLLAIALFSFDIYTKNLVFEHFAVEIQTSSEEKTLDPLHWREIYKQVFIPAHPPYQAIEIIPDFFYLHIVVNRGAVWGIMQGQRIFLTLVSMAAILFILYVLLFRPEMRAFWLPMSLIMSGALGNLWDRIWFEGVRDFLDFYLGSYHWPTFNFADVFIVVGVSLFILKELRANKKAKEAHQGETVGQKQN